MQNRNRGKSELSSHILVSSSGLFMKSWIAWCRGNHLLIEAFKAVIHLEEMKDQQLSLIKCYVCISLPFETYL